MQKMWMKAVVGVFVLSISSAQATETCDDILTKIQSELTLYVSRRSASFEDPARGSVQDIYEKVIQKQVSSDPSLLDRCPKLRSLLAIVEAGKKVKSDVARAGNGTERGGNGTERGGNGTERGGNGTERGGNGTERGGNGTERGGNGTERGGNGTERGGNGTERGLMGFFNRVFGGKPSTNKMEILTISRRSAQIDQATAFLGLATVVPERATYWGFTDREAFGFEFDERVKTLSLGEIQGREIFEEMFDRNEIALISVKLKVRSSAVDGSCPVGYFDALESELRDLNRGLSAGFDIASRSQAVVGASQYMNSVLEALRESESRILEIRQKSCPSSIIVGVRFESAANPARSESHVERE